MIARRSRIAQRLGLLTGVVALAAFTALALGEALGPSTREAVPRTHVLTIAADPNNLPFSNDRLEGFENRIAELLARDLGARIRYVWRAQRRGFFRAAWSDDSCDLVLGVPAGSPRALTTAPYYRSRYVFVTRTDRGLADLRRLDDPRLAHLIVGVPLIGGEGATPPAIALGRTRAAGRVVGFPVMGDYREPDPPARIVDAVARGDVDAAVVWGPLAGYFATREPHALRLVPVETAEGEVVPFAFDIAVAVRKDETELCHAIDAALVHHRDAIARILDAYGVPREPIAPKVATASATQPEGR